MAKVWSGREEEASFGGERSKRGAAREAKRKYQQKEMELETARTELSKVQADVRVKRESLARARRGIEKRQLEILQLEREQRDLERALEELEQGRAARKTRVSNIEHDVEQLREAAFRGQSFGA